MFDRLLPPRLVCPFLLSAASPTLTGGMSQLPQSHGGNSSKRKQDTAAAAAAGLQADTPAPDDRAVRQRTVQMQPAVATPTAAATTSAAAAPSLSTPLLSFLRLAVVGRQLIMQGLDLISLARLASTCRQMRGEALDKEAGKFISPPRGKAKRSAPPDGHLVHQPHSAHDSPLFRKHAPMILWCGSDSTPLDNELLIQKTAQFSRIVSFGADDSDWWTEERQLYLLSRPCMQHVTELNLSWSLQWVARPPVQTALLRLPRLETFDTVVGRNTMLLPSAFALASQLSWIVIQLRRRVLPAGSLRALRHAPAATSLTLDFPQQEAPLPPELPWCLPPTLTDLTLWNADFSHGVSRPLVKALFSRTPMLTSLRLNSVSLEASLRGLLDAGVAALPALRDVRFGHTGPVQFSVGVEPDPVEPIFRRFLHRFPQVTVRIEFLDWMWDDSEQLRAVQLRYVGWSRIEMYCTDSQERIGGPPIPHPEDADAGSDVEELKDPLAAEAH